MIAIKNYDKAAQEKTNMIQRIHLVAQPTNMFYLISKQKDKSKYQVKVTYLMLAKGEEKRDDFVDQYRKKPRKISANFEESNHSQLCV